MNPPSGPIDDYAYTYMSSYRSNSGVYELFMIQKRSRTCVHTTLTVREDPIVPSNSARFGEWQPLSVYAKGGGLSLGSSYFYLEFLLAWLNLLQQDR